MDRISRFWFWRHQGCLSAICRWCGPVGFIEQVSSVLTGCFHGDLRAPPTLRPWLWVCVLQTQHTGPNVTLRQKLVQPRDKTPKQKLSGVISVEYTDLCIREAKLLNKCMVHHRRAAHQVKIQWFTCILRVTSFLWTMMCHFAQRRNMVWRRSKRSHLSDVEKLTLNGGGLTFHLSSIYNVELELQTRWFHHGCKVKHLQQQRKSPIALIQSFGSQVVPGFHQLLLSENIINKALCFWKRNNCWWRYDLITQMHLGTQFNARREWTHPLRCILMQGLKRALVWGSSDDPLHHRAAPVYEINSLMLTRTAVKRVHIRVQSICRDWKLADHVHHLHHTLKERTLSWYYGKKTTSTNKQWIQG